MIDRFKIRVYGLLFNEHKEVLLSHESAKGIKFSKFPGGGLEFGEGSHDCLKREFIEELGLPLEKLEHFYTTEHFFQSAFRNSDQIMSLYYRVYATNQSVQRLERPSFASPNEDLYFEWYKISELKEDIFRFPIDKIVAAKLRALKL